MITRMKKWGMRVLLVCMMTLFIPAQILTSFAADGKITFTDLTVTTGEEFSIRVKIAATSGKIARSEMMLSYDASALEFVEGSGAQGGAGSISLSATANQSETQVYTLKFKALQAGDTTITVNSQEVYDTDENIMNITHTGSSSVKVQASASYSSDAALKSLKVSPGSLTPTFSPDVTSYSVEVGLETEKLIVDAVPNNSNAKTSISGAELTENEGTVVCRVTAEDGQTVKEYTISVTKTENGETTSPNEEVNEPTYTPGDMSAMVAGVTYEVATQFDESTLPEGFEAINYSYHDVEVRAGKGLQKDLILLYLKDEAGNGELYIYNEETDSFSPWVEISVSAKSIVILPIEEDVEIPDGFVEASIDVNIGEDQKRTVSGWVWETDEEHQYCVFYGMNWNGDKGLYRYDFKEMTIQRYFQDPAVDTGISREIYDAAITDYNSLVLDYNIRMGVIVALIVAVILLLTIVIVLAVKLAGRKKQNPPSNPDRRGRRSVKEEPEDAWMRQERDADQKDEYKEADDTYADGPYTKEPHTKEAYRKESNRYADDGYAEDAYDANPYAGDQYADDRYVDDGYADDRHTDRTYVDDRYTVDSGKQNPRTDSYRESDQEKNTAKSRMSKDEDDLEIVDDLDDEEDDFDLIDLDDER
ncbi:MAG: cadherin-like beta sandwich domain-containing protein [bacterium]|nr:cadherin-like beta sandwich domain-containing protein [bacterium]